VNYLGGNMRDLTLNFSRPGGQVVCQYFNFLRLGREGYRKVHAACYATARYLAAEIGRLGPFEIVFGGEDQAGIPAVCWKLREDSAVSFNLYALADRLRVRGWQVPAYTLPAHCQEITVQRILVRHGVSRDLADLLLENIRQALAFFESHPGQYNLSGEEASGFHH
jgi:glutamate decarboxylase